VVSRLLAPVANLQPQFQLSICRCSFSDLRPNCIRRSWLSSSFRVSISLSRCSQTAGESQSVPGVRPKAALQRFSIELAQYPEVSRQHERSMP